MGRTVWILFLCAFSLIPELLANHGVCKISQRVTKKDIEPTRVTYIERYEETCYKLWTCKKTRYNYHWVNRDVWKTSYEYKYHCCQGYSSDGVGSLNSPNIICKPYCSDGCPNGSKCTSPQKCSCIEGYKNLYDKCIPICTVECVNATCTAPNTCRCLDGFINIIGSTNECAPHCSQECYNGFCISPEQCACHDGYEKINDTCNPICTDECVNATCNAPNTCQCFDGFINILGSTNECAPHCSQECYNGVCISPEQCACHDGYEKINDTCNPICTDECINATCTAPDTCACFDGFNKTPDSINICIPYCSQGCSNGVCVDPEVCICDEGYEKSNNNCNPYCKGGCGNGTCVEPNKCQCDEGHKNADNNTCIPHCNNCINGICVAPETCKCYDGFELIDGDCQPICNSCVNAVCKAPEECECLPGYIYVTEIVCAENIELKTETSLSTITYSNEMSSEDGILVTSAQYEDNNIIIKPTASSSGLSDANIESRAGTSNWIFFVIGLAVVMVLSGVLIVIWKKRHHFKRGGYSTEDSESSIIFNGANTVQR